MSQMTAELTAELNAPPEPKSRQKRAKKDPATGQRVVGKRGPARPYRKLPDELLTLRVTKLTSRLERHEDTKRLLTKYSAEKTFRLRDTLAPIPSDLAGDGEVAEAPHPPEAAQ